MLISKSTPGQKFNTERLQALHKRLSFEALRKRLSFTFFFFFPGTKDLTQDPIHIEYP